MVEFKISEVSNSSALDMCEIVNLINESYWVKNQHFFIDCPVSYNRITSQELDEMLSDPYKKVYLLEEQCTRKTVGVIVLEVPPYEEWAKFGIFAISKDYQGKNKGKDLIFHVEMVAKKLLRKSMRIEVLSFLKKLGIYYQKLGYVYTGKTKSFSHSEYVKTEHRGNTSQYLQELEKIL